MDMFMDKLAQKLNAQEIIRANTAADAEELNKLKDRVAEYNNCLDKLQKLLEDGSAKLDGAQVNGAELNQLIAESLEKIRAIQQDTECLEALQEKLTGKMTEVEGNLRAGLVSSEQSILEQMSERIATAEENVHKECVKVYRNVQAVVTEEGTKQNETLGQISDKVVSVKGKVGAVLGISIVSLILSLGSVALLVLQMLNFKFF